MHEILPKHARYQSLEVFPHKKNMNPSKVGENHSHEISPCKKLLRQLLLFASIGKKKD